MGPENNGGKAQMFTWVPNMNFTNESCVLRCVLSDAVAKLNSTIHLHLEITHRGSSIECFETLDYGAVLVCVYIYDVKIFLQHELIKLYYFELRGT